MGEQPTGLEVRFVADLLAHIDRRVEDCGARMAQLEHQLANTMRWPNGEPAEAVSSLRAQAVVLEVQIKRLHVATTLLQAYMQVRRGQLAELRAAENRHTTTTEVS